MSVGRHWVFKQRRWYGSCGTCGRVVVWNRAWQATMDLLEFHVREHVTLDSGGPTQAQ